MFIERWDGMPPGDAEPGKVWFHVTVIIKDMHGERPSGYLFQAAPTANDRELMRAAAEVVQKK